MTSSPETVKLRALQIFSAALITGIALFSIFAVGVNEFSLTGDSVLKLPFALTMWVTGGITVLFIALARYMYKKKTEAIRHFSAAGQDKLIQYRTALVRYMALAEMPGLFSIILFFITGNYWVLIIVGFVVLAMLNKFPTRQRVITDAGLDWQEQDLLI